ncbi:hypothetical protein [Lysobacter capsici]|uniref:hypothetical protein n=1 Tax=Lysobacter capsici TaxID=435897 RepID=UPI0012FD9D80|nr:hypothetical protein [Lysobacter capsici]
MALAVVQGCVTRLIDIGRPLTASVAAPAQTDTSSVSLTIALSRSAAQPLGRSADAMGDARDRSDDADQGKRLQTLRLAAVAACLAAITRSPDQAPVLAQLLAEIQSPV